MSDVRLTGPRSAVLEALRSESGEVRDPGGRATDALHRVMVRQGYAGDLLSIRQVLKGMDVAGLIWRDTRATRTYSIRAVHEAGLPDKSHAAPANDTGATVSPPPVVAEAPPPASPRPRPGPGPLPVPPAPSTPPVAAAAPVATGSPRPAVPERRPTSSSIAAALGCRSLAVFVDARWLVSQAGQSCHGTGERSALDVDLPRLLDIVSAAVGCMGDLLRIYWYDGMSGAELSAGQVRLSRRGGIRARFIGLDDLRRGGLLVQLVHDLHTVGVGAADGLLVAAGDRLLLPTLTALADTGVRVGLLTPEGPSGQEAIGALAEVADVIVTLPRPELAAAVRRRNAGDPRPDPTASRPRQVLPPPPNAYSRAGTAFAVRWAMSTTAEERQLVQASAPHVPEDVYPQLIRAVEAETGESLRDNPAGRHAARNAFWRALGDAQ